MFLVKYFHSSNEPISRFPWNSIQNRPAFLLLLLSENNEIYKILRQFQILNHPSLWISTNDFILLKKYFPNILYKNQKLIYHHSKIINRFIMKTPKRVYSLRFSFTQERVRKRHPRMYLCLTHGAFLREKDRIPFGWCSRTQPIE